MAKLTPEQIFAGYKSGEMDQTTAINYLKTILENSEKTGERIKVLEVFMDIDIFNKALYKFFENLLLSDKSERIRAKSLEIVVEHYFKTGINAIKWTIENEKSPLSLVSLIKSLDLLTNNINSEKTKKKIHNYLLRTEQNVKRAFKHEKNTDFLWKLYKSMDLNNSKKLKILKELMEQNIGKKYVQKYDIPPREAMALGLLERELGVELLDQDVYPGLYENYATFIARLISENNDSRKLNIHVIDIGIHSYRCKRIKFLSLLPYLKVLSIFYSGLEQLNGLKTLKKLEILNLTGNPIKNLPNLNYLTNLKKLYIGSTFISKLSGLESLKNLERIEMDESHIPYAEQERIERLIKLNRIKLKSV